MNTVAQQHGIAVSWLDKPAELSALGTEWQDLADRVGADVFMRPDWMAVWWPHFGAGRQLACMVAHRDGVLIGVLPFVVERIWLGLLPLRIARLAGIDPNCIAFQLSLEDAWAKPVLQAAMLHLICNLGCSAVSFTPVSDVAGHLAILQGLSGQDLNLDPGHNPKRGPNLAVLDEEAGSHITFDFTPKFDDYLARLTKKRRGQFRRDVKGLKELFGMTQSHFVPNAEAFDDFIAFHALQWQAVGRGGHFVDWPGSAAFYHDLAAQTAATKLVQLDLMSGTDGALASEFSLVAGHTAHWRLPARRLDADVDRLSAGKVVFLLMFERMIAGGITRIEAGRGDYGYKIEYGGQTVPVHRLIVSGGSRLARLRLKLLLRYSDLLHLLYYRIWFLKLAPRLRKLTGGRARPLWRSWIRSRL